MDKFETKHKAFIKMEKELQDIREVLRNLPLIPYEKPIQSGWYITYEMREDIARRVDSFDIQQVIDLGYGTTIVHNVKHVRMMRAGIKGYYYTKHNKRAWCSFAPGRRYIKEKEYEKLAPQLQKHFYRPHWWDEEYSLSHRNMYLAFIPSYWLVLRARPRYVTHYRERGGELEKRQAFLEYKLEEYYRTLSNGWRYKRWSKNPYRQETRSHKQQFLKSEIEDIPNVSYKKSIKR